MPLANLKSARYELALVHPFILVYLMKGMGKCADLLAPADDIGIVCNAFQGSRLAIRR